MTRRLNKRDFLEDVRVSRRRRGRRHDAGRALRESADADQMAAADLCRPGACRARHPKLDRRGSTRPPTARWRSSSTRPTSWCRTASCSAPCSRARSTPRRAMTTRLRRRSTSRCSAPISRFASRYSLDVPALWHWHGLKEIWEEAYAEIARRHLALDRRAGIPATSAPPSRSTSLADLKGLRVYTFPTGGQFLSQFGVVPVSLPYEDVQPAMQTGELDGVCWCGITEMHTVGWANVLKYYLDQSALGRLGRLLLRQHREVERRAGAPPAALQAGDRCLALLSPPLVLGRRGQATATSDKLELTTIPAAEWKTGRGRGLQVLGRDRRAEPDAAPRLSRSSRNTTKSMTKAGCALPLRLSFEADAAARRPRRPAVPWNDNRAAGLRQAQGHGRWPAISLSTS